MSTCFVLFLLCFLIAGSRASYDRVESFTSTFWGITTEEPQNQTERIEESSEPGFKEGSEPKNSSKDDDSIRGTVNRRSFDEVCYPQVGCFDVKEPWFSHLRPVNAPESPGVMRTTLHFYTRKNLKKPVYISLYPKINMRSAEFNSSKKSVLIVHGFKSSGNFTWMKKMKNVYLQEVDANVMIVDWGGGAQRRGYFQVVGNTRVVGKQLILFVRHLINNHQADPGKFHLIGHSLGAQICSYLAKEVKGIGRLTALDPAQPYFEGFERKVRLDKTDAKFVDVIHTDSRPFIPNFGFGMIAPHGHIDFYMNGGFFQPGCYTALKRGLIFRTFSKMANFQMERLSHWVSCSHGRAYMYFTEALNSTNKCVFWGRKADTRNVFQFHNNKKRYKLIKKMKPISPKCTPENCVAVGLNTDKSPLRGIFVVSTSRAPPYCALRKLKKARWRFFFRRTSS